MDEKSQMDDVLAVLKQADPQVSPATVVQLIQRILEANKRLADDNDHLRRIVQSLAKFIV